MIIIAGYSTLNRLIERDTIVASSNFVERARKAEGCLDFSISADSVDKARINVFECWRDQQSLDAWRKVAKGPNFKPREVSVKLFRTLDPEPPL
jgi:quinol monooxygenase YgiN